MSKITYVGSRKTRNAAYTPAARAGMLDMAERELRRFTYPQRINEAWWYRNLGFHDDWLTNGISPWATLRVMMSRNSDEGKGVGTRFVRFQAGFVSRRKYDRDRQGYNTYYGAPIVSQRQPALRQRGSLNCCTAACHHCGKKNDHVWLES